ncbi:MAG: indolepyruvate ferredoxin oxidoreductase [Hyphomicrobiales bacterium]|nr:MAG: indolepyruvate ferredoxin oxidoreductase [Hyphomicrobiales bacterium]
MTIVPREISLDDKYVRTEGSVYLTGIQALVRLVLDRGRLDRAARLKTGGMISGYRGSPLGGFDQELMRAGGHLSYHDIVFQPGVNEELGAHVVWGSQKLDLKEGDSDFDGVFGVWYGKAPGVDRAGDALKQANASGTARHGGVLALAGDDHLAKSSILPAQSEFAFRDAEIPVLNPADLQEVIDYGLHGFELSRFSGLWTGLICLADTMDSSGIVSVDPNRLQFYRPVNSDPRAMGELNRPLLLANRLETEHLLREVRLPAAQAYVRANRLDHVAFGAKRARIGIIASGKAYRDIRQALALLGIDEERAEALGIGIYKVAMPWPLEPLGIGAFTRGVEKLLIVEHKRALIEPQVKAQLYHHPAGERPAIWGKTTPEGAPFLPDVLELSIAEMVRALSTVLPDIAKDAAMRAVADRLEEQLRYAESHGCDAGRSPYFCSGCPHSTSTKVPDGSRAMPGIGCHAMTEISGRTTEGQVAMGGEGVPWVGQAPFSKTKHMFVDLGDGTYFHSGLLAIRQAVAAKVPVTYKILYNDAVAMTGGQAVDGTLTVPQLTRQLEAEGVRRIVLVSDNPDTYRGRQDLAAGVPIHHRDELISVEEELAAYPGVSVLIFDQVCAAEKRRRRKKGQMDDPALRLVINERVCEDCGDCSVQSNCLSVEPLATDFGTKRTINQSSCNKDFSCVKGFCPSFAWVEGGTVKKADGAALDIDALKAALPLPTMAALDRPLNLLIAGIGGMGVTTTAAVLAMAAHVDGLNATTLDMTGLAQKGGPVTSHVRFAAKDMAIDGPRVPTASLDVLLASDMLVAAGSDTLSLIDHDRTVTLGNGRVAPTAEFVLKQTQSFEAAKLAAILREASARTEIADLAGIAEKLLGDAIFTNMLAVGMAFQHGLLPMSVEAMETAIRLNGAAVAANLKAFHAGRVLAAAPDKITGLLPAEKIAKAMDLDERIAFLAEELGAYQNAAYAARYAALVERVRVADAAQGSSMRLTGLVAESLYRLMAVKDEYEVARLYAAPAYREAVAAQFEDGARLKVVIAPPFVSATDPATGRPKKRAFGPWMLKAFGLLAKFKGLRGSVLDPFSRQAERKAERALLARYEADIEMIFSQLGTTSYGLLCEIARVPELVRGYGPVKMANMESADKRRAMLLGQLAMADLPGPAEVATPARRARLEAVERITEAAE